MPACLRVAVRQCCSSRPQHTDMAAMWAPCEALSPSHDTCAQLKETADAEEEEAGRCRARLQHLAKLGAPTVDGALTWNFQRMDRILADHMLRHGQLESARQLASEAGIEVRSPGLVKTVQRCLDVPNTTGIPLLCCVRVVATSSKATVLGAACTAEQMIIVCKSLLLAWGLPPWHIRWPIEVTVTRTGPGDRPWQLCDWPKRAILPAAL